MLIDVIYVRTFPDYQLCLEFKNGERRRFDYEATTFHEALGSRRVARAV